jgi:hypothetical protein
MSYGQPPPPYGYGPAQQPGYGYGHGAGPGMPVGPRPHPSANTALALGFGGVLCLGALLGVPAILMGRSVVRAAEAEPHRWTGRGAAQVGIVLGWISVFETAVVVTVSLARGVTSAVAWIVAGVVGLTLLALGGVQTLPRPVVAVTSTLRRASLAVGLVLGGVLLGGVMGLASSVAAAKQAAEACRLAKADYAARAGAEDFARTREAIREVETKCPADGAELTRMRA